MREFARECMLHIRYGTWLPVRLDIMGGAVFWYVQRYWIIFPIEVEGPMTKREAEGLAASYNDGRGL